MQKATARPPLTREPVTDLADNPIYVSYIAILNGDPWRAGQSIRDLAKSYPIAEYSREWQEAGRAIAADLRAADPCPGV